ncbi:hypothetical protein C0J52_26055 [Blattella germanica]|nr:hypothetical protein C0J52_26055 [Blattella germanica]
MNAASGFERQDHVEWSSIRAVSHPSLDLEFTSGREHMTEQPDMRETETERFTVQMVGARAKCLSPMLAGSAGDLLVMVLVVLVVQELPVVVVLVFEVVQLAYAEFSCVIFKHVAVKMQSIVVILRILEKRPSGLNITKHLFEHLIQSSKFRIAENIGYLYIESGYVTILCNILTILKQNFSTCVGLQLSKLRQSTYNCSKVSKINLINNI